MSASTRAIWASRRSSSATWRCAFCPEPPYCGHDTTDGGREARMTASETAQEHHAAVLAAAHKTALLKAAEVRTSTPHMSIVAHIQNWAAQWSSVVMIVFFLCL